MERFVLVVRLAVGVLQSIMRPAAMYVLLVTLDVTVQMVVLQLGEFFSSYLLFRSTKKDFSSSTQ